MSSGSKSARLEAAALADAVALDDLGWQHALSSFCLRLAMMKAKERRLERLLDAGLVALRKSLIFGCISIASSRSSAAGSNSFTARVGRVPLTSSQASKCLRRKHHRHAVMQRRDCAIGGAGQDGDACRSRRRPCRASARRVRQRRSAAAPRAEQEGPALALGSGPFVEAVGRNQAAAPAHGIAERRLLQHLLGAGIDQGRELSSDP